MPGPRSPGSAPTAAGSSRGCCTARCGARCRTATRSSARRGSEAGNLTTPGPIDLQATLAALVALGARGAAMEVSSHSLDQGRVDGLAFRAAIFTNLTRDHLDYHKTMEQYFKSKAKLLQLLAPGGLEVVNADDPAWQRLRKE